MFRVLVAVTCALALSACTTLNIKRPVSEDDLKSIKRLGVVSLLGDSFQGVSVGTTVFNNQSFSSPVPDWQVDAHASTTALDLLKTNTRLSTALLDRTRLSPEQAQAEGGKLLWQAAEQQGFDRLVVIRPGVSDNNPFFRPSFGLFERSLLGSGRRCVYAAFVVDVYDVASRKPIAWEWGGGMPCELGKDSDLPFKAPFAAYTDAERADIRRRLQVRLSEALGYSLRKLSLVPTNTPAR